MTLSEEDSSEGISAILTSDFCNHLVGTECINAWHRWISHLLQSRHIPRLSIFWGRGAVALQICRGLLTFRGPLATDRVSFLNFVPCRTMQHYLFDIVTQEVSDRDGYDNGLGDGMSGLAIRTGSNSSRTMFFFSPKAPSANGQMSNSNKETSVGNSTGSTRRPPPHHSPPQLASPRAIRQATSEMRLLALKQMLLQTQSASTPSSHATLPAPREVVCKNHQRRLPEICGALSRDFMAGSIREARIVFNLGGWNRCSG